MSSATEEADWGATATGRRRRGAAASGVSYRDPSLRDMMNASNSQEDDDSEDDEDFQGEQSGIVCDRIAQPPSSM